MNEYPCILVVTPTLGVSPFLDRTVDSITFQPLRIRHVISTPASMVPILAARYPHALVVPDAGREGGIYGAINAGIVAARFDWEWFTYINDDDTLLRGFGRAALRHFRSLDAEPVLYGDVELIDEDERRVSRITTTPSPAWIPALLHQGISPLMQQGMLFRRHVVHALGGFDQRYRLCADLDFWLRAYAAGHRFRHHAENVAQFRLRRGQLSGDTSVTMREQDDIVARHLPARPGALRRRLVRLAYRAYNLPRYLERVRKQGMRGSYQILREGLAR